MKKLITILCIITSLTVMAQEKETQVIIKTNMGDITVKLYNDTPKHRDNFIKLVNEGWFVKSPFHRVIRNFMIQGGQNANGQLDPGYKVEAEFVPAHFHKKGALAAARQGDQVNPRKMSSGSQFYIVQGQKWDDNMLNMMSQRYGKTFTEEQKQVYKTLGGSPHLDGDYTVFGEVVEGLDVVDKIGNTPTNPGDVPATPVYIISMEIVK